LRFKDLTQASRFLTQGQLKIKIQQVDPEGLRKLLLQQGCFARFPGAPQEGGAVLGQSELVNPFYTFRGFHEQHIMTIMAIKSNCS
jgi:hypothetical protein